MERIDYTNLKKDFLNLVGASGIMPAIIEVDGASKEGLLKLAETYGLEVEKYIEDHE